MRAWELIFLLVSLLKKGHSNGIVCNNSKDFGYDVQNSLNWGDCKKTGTLTELKTLQITYKDPTQPKIDKTISISEHTVFSIPEVKTKNFRAHDLIHFPNDPIPLHTVTEYIKPRNDSFSIFCSPLECITIPRAVSHTLVPSHIRPASYCGDGHFIFTALLENKEHGYGFCILDNNTYYNEGHRVISLHTKNIFYLTSLELDSITTIDHTPLSPITIPTPLLEHDKLKNSIFTNYFINPSSFAPVTEAPAFSLSRVFTPLTANPKRLFVVKTALKVYSLEERDGELHLIEEKQEASKSKPRVLLQRFLAKDLPYTNQMPLPYSAHFSAMYYESYGYVKRVKETAMSGYRALKRFIAMEEEWRKKNPKQKREERSVKEMTYIKGGRIYLYSYVTYCRNDKEEEWESILGRVIAGEKRRNWDEAWKEREKGSFSEIESEEENEEEDKWDWRNWREWLILPQAPWFKIVMQIELAVYIVVLPIVLFCMGFALFWYERPEVFIRRGKTDALGEILEVEARNEGGEVLLDWKVRLPNKQETKEVVNRGEAVFETAADKAKMKRKKQERRELKHSLTPPAML